MRYATLGASLLMTAGAAFLVHRLVMPSKAPRKPHREVERDPVDDVPSIPVDEVVGVPERDPDEEPCEVRTNEKIVNPVKTDFSTKIPPFVYDYTKELWGTRYASDQGELRFFEEGCRGLDLHPFCQEVILRGVEYRMGRDGWLSARYNLNYGIAKIMGLKDLEDPNDCSVWTQATPLQAFELLFSGVIKLKNMSTSKKKRADLEARLKSEMGPIEVPARLDLTNNLWANHVKWSTPDSRADYLKQYNGLDIPRIGREVILILLDRTRDVQKTHTVLCGALKIPQGSPEEVRKAIVEVGWSRRTTK